MIIVSAWIAGVVFGVAVFLSWAGSSDERCARAINLIQRLRQGWD